MRAALIGLVLCGVLVMPAPAQRLMERTANLPNAVIPFPGMLEASITNRFGRVPSAGLGTVATLDLAMGLPWLWPLEWSPGLRFGAAADGAPADWEPYARFGLLRQDAGAPFDLFATAAYSDAAGSVAGEALVARRLGGLRVIGGGRVLEAGAGDVRVGVVAGGVLHVMPAVSPVVLTADVATLLRRDGEAMTAWSAGVHTGLPHTALSVALQATNALRPTLHGGVTGAGRTRWGLEINAPVEFTGFLLGFFASRDQARRAVEETQGAVPAATVSIRGYLYSPSTLHVRAGDVVEWVNGDDVVHTVDHEGGGFRSGGLQPGDRWQARFSEPGIYAYYCGPHPFMKGTVVVR